MKEKLEKLGIKNILELANITGRRRRICQAVWYGERPMSLGMARIIKKKFNVPLDYLLK